MGLPGDTVAGGLTKSRDHRIRFQVSFGQSPKIKDTLG